MNGAAYGPCSRNQMNGAVTFYRQIGPYAITQCDAPVLGKRHAVARRWCLTAKKWRSNRQSSARLSPGLVMKHPPYLTAKDLDQKTYLIGNSR